MPKFQRSCNSMITWPLKTYPATGPNILMPPSSTLTTTYYHLKYSPNELLLGLGVNSGCTTALESIGPPTEHDVTVHLALVEQQCLDGYSAVVDHKAKRQIQHQTVPTCATKHNISTKKPSTGTCNTVGLNLCVHQEAHPHVVHSPSHQNSTTKLVHLGNPWWQAFII